MLRRTSYTSARTGGVQAHALPKISRRTLLASGLVLTTPSQARAGLFAPAQDYIAPVASGPVIDVPMERLRLPRGTAGRDYVLVKLRVRGQGPFDFMVDSGLTAELITPHLQRLLGISGSGKQLSNGLTAGGQMKGADLVQLRDAALVGPRGDLPLPPLTAVVTNFIQEHLDPNHDPVEGMLGQELLAQFDSDFDFNANRLRLWAPGAGAAVAAQAGLVRVPAAVLNETGLLGIRVTSTAAAAQGGQPFVGIIDCGASFSALNWQAAALAGLPPKGDRLYAHGTPIYGVGIDGKPVPLPTTPLSLTYVGDPIKGNNKQLSFEQPRGWRPWDSVALAVGDLPVFSQLLGDGRTPFSGPAALIGLDVLAQRRVILGAGVGKRGRQRELYVSPR